MTRLRLSLAALVLAACAGRSAAPQGGTTARGSAAAPASAAARPTEARAGAPWWNGAVFYEVFVRSFQDSNGDGKGDLAGLIDRLDALNDGKPETTTDLGVDALWLMPVFESPSYHGYDVVDYERIEQDYGTNADFDRLLAEAHRRGIRVIVDLVLNHTSDQHPWFVDSASSPTSPKRDWYVWRKDDPGWTQPWSQNPTWHLKNGAYYYGLFWSGMPDLNYRNPAVREEMLRIAERWIRAGVDGYRLDAVRHLYEDGPGRGQEASPENVVFLRELAARVKAVNPKAVLVGEVWSNAADISTYYGSEGKPGLDLLFDFPLAGAIVSSVNAGTGSEARLALAETLKGYPPGAVDAPFLTNHDQQRLATQLGLDPAKERLAAAVLLTLPGAPFLYYGEEIGMPNGPGGEDEWKRTPMPWSAGPGGGFTTAPRPWMPFAPGTPDRINVAAQVNDRGSLLGRYRALVAARKGSEALRTGSTRIVDAQAPRGAVLAFVRETPTERVLVVHNFGAEPVETATLAVDGAAAEPVFADGTAKLVREGSGWRATMPPRSSAAWRVR